MSADTDARDDQGEAVNELGFGRKAQGAPFFPPLSRRKLTALKNNPSDVRA
jgi:hypothetical protein